MASLPRPSVATLASSCFASTKTALTDCISSIQQKREEQNRLKQNKTELSDFGTFEKGEGEPEEFDEFGLSGEKITEWQAGWNVTNAIQVKKETAIL